MSSTEEIYYTCNCTLHHIPSLDKAISSVSARGTSYIVTFEYKGPVLPSLSLNVGYLLEWQQSQLDK